MRLFSKDHKEVIGTVPDPEASFAVTFDDTGHAEVDEAVGNYLLQLGAAVQVQQPEKQKDSNEDPKTPEQMNPAQLKKLAKDNGIDIGEASKKDELLPIINAFLEQKSKDAAQQEKEEAEKAKGQGGGAGDQE